MRVGVPRVSPSRGPILVAGEDFEKGAGLKLSVEHDENVGLELDRAVDLLPGLIGTEGDRGRLQPVRPRDGPEVEDDRRLAGRGPRELVVDAEARERACLEDFPGHRYLTFELPHKVRAGSPSA